MDQQFDYQIVKDGRVRVFWGGREVVTLAGARATKFLRQVEGLDDEGKQLLLARMTGNFKRGNERDPHRGD
ncbi:MAG: hypothetical protein R3B81_03970 [bacterium]